jgi:hypothetical protein
MLSSLSKTNQGTQLFLHNQILNLNNNTLIMEHSLIELLTYYVIVAVLFIGAPAVFFTIVFMPALMNTKGAVVGYKIHRDYGETSIYSKVN